MKIFYQILSKFHKKNRYKYNFLQKVFNKKVVALVISKHLILHSTFDQLPIHECITMESFGAKKCQILIIHRYLIT